MAAYTSNLVTTACTSLGHMHRK